MVSTHEGIRNNAVKLIDILLSAYPFLLLICSIPILGNVTETEYVDNLLLILVFNDPIVNALHLIGSIL